jgi:glycerol-3-phosphate dehydrogenase (NAD(P)+)
VNISVLGSGIWGRAFGECLQANGHEVVFLDMPDTDWHPGGPGDLVVLGVPCQLLRGALQRFRSPNVPVASLIKGIEISTGKRVSQVIRDVWPHAMPAAISGPSFASEVRARKPTAVVTAAEGPDIALQIQNAVHCKLFRVYRSSDLLGVELGGALKNVYALAGGMCQGLGAGQNAMAALMTRSLAEMVRLATTLGARAETLYGLSGMGDLVLTAYSGESRNHQVGEALARGLSLEEAQRNLKGIAEGVPTTRAVFEIVQRESIRAPVVTELYRVLYEGKSPQAALNDLVNRQPNYE